MAEIPADRSDPTPEQVLYARVLEIGSYVGLLCLLVTFALYVTGLIPPYIPVDDLPEYWCMSVGDEEGEYLHEAEIPDGWGWVGMLRYGDFLNFIGVAILAGVTVVCYLSIVPSLLRNKDGVYALLALLEAVVLIVAASGVIEIGH